MLETTVENLAQVVGVSVEKLLGQIEGAGIQNMKRQSIFRNTDKVKLLKALRTGFRAPIEPTQKNPSSSSSKQKKTSNLKVLSNDVSDIDKKLSRQYPRDFSKLKYSYSEDHGDTVFKSLNSGVAVLANDEELDQYLYSYGRMHEAKLKVAYFELFKSMNLSGDKKIRILDYACGQGLASVVLLNHLEQHHQYGLSNLDEITLIEPSKAALNRADTFLNKSAPLSLINKAFDDLTSLDLKGKKVSSTQGINIHLFSNILDMGDAYFDLDKLIDTVSKSYQGINYFVCVSPLNKEKLDYFQSEFECHDGFEQIYSYDGCFKKPHNWKIKCNIFKIGK